MPVLGIAENMSIRICSKCGHEKRIFGQGGGENMPQEYGVDILGSLPLDIQIREETGGGKPTVVAGYGAVHQRDRPQDGRLATPCGLALR